MKYVRNFESFKNNKNSEPVNEEFLGNLFKKLKNKFSLGYSKMFGSAKEVDGMIEEYKTEITNLKNVPRKALEAYMTYIKKSKDGADNEEEKNKLTEDLTKSKENYEKQLELAKQKFDIKVKEVVDDEKNPKIQNYINLKKIEMQQELLTEDSKIIINSGLSEEDIKNNPAIQEYVDEGKTKMEESEKMAEDQKKALDAGGEESKGEESVEYKVGDEVIYKRDEFKENEWDALTDDEKNDIESDKMKQMLVSQVGIKSIESIDGDKIKFSKEDGNPLEKTLNDVLMKVVEKSEKEDEYKEGDKVKYNSQDGENEGEVMNQEGVVDGMIRLKTKNTPNGFAVGRDKLISKI